MEFIAKKTDIASYKSGCAVVFCVNNTLLPSIDTLPSAIKQSIENELKTGGLGKKLGSNQWISFAPTASEKFERLLVVNLDANDGKNAKSAFDIKALRTLSQKLAKTLIEADVKYATLFLDSFLEVVKSDITYKDVAQELATEISRHLYVFALPSQKKVAKKALQKIGLVAQNSAELKALKEGLMLGEAYAEGINTARLLGDLPGNICTPSYLASEAKKMAADSSKVSVKVLGEKQMDKLGMHSFLSVSKGSCEEGKLICIEYKGKASSKSPHVLVGKGITFDTGGISLKPGSGMDEMKYDMCGAASVFGTLKALIDLQAKVHVVGIIAAAENMPNSNASKPGDIVTSMSGQTIEILNTDAEGRLVLCDALTYAERYKPKSVIDIATLTGACIVALGKHASALYSNNEKLTNALKDSSKVTHDRVWEMPLWDDYQQQLKSNFADMANIGGPGGGSITAACFLARYTKKYPWAHLDIAGTAWLNGAKKGATGRPVSLLTHYILNN